ncbi:MAG: TonB-dependent receptor, partial [Cellvibrionales bacterium]|nr:TonB-dependent receptor [Cellvibrionales bacterium]
VALAEEPAATGPGLEEIVVTATKREQNLMTAPLAVSAFDQDRLIREGVQDVTNIGSLVPNMQVGLSPSDSGVQVTVRGITSNNFTELGDPTVAIHVDGVFTPRPQAGLALMHDVERVEILRGPQGTLFGRNSTSGAVNIISARPKFGELDSQLNWEFGNYDRRAMRGWFNLSNSDIFATRFSFYVDRADSWLDQVKDEFDLALDVEGDPAAGHDNQRLITGPDSNPTGPRDLPADGIAVTDQRLNRAVDESDAYFNSDKWATRLSFRFQPSENFDWLLSWDNFQDNGAGNLSLKDCEKAAGTFFACDHDQWYARINVPGEKDFNIQTLRSEMIWQLPTTVVELRLANSIQKRFQQHDGDAGAFTDPDHPAYGIDRLAAAGQQRSLLIKDRQRIVSLGFEPFVRFPFEDLRLTTRYSDYDSKVAELQFKSSEPLNGTLSWIAGLFHLEEINDVRLDVEIPTCCNVGLPLAQAFVQPDRRVSSTAAFAQFDWAVTPQLNLTFGYRYTQDEKSDKGGSNHLTTGYWVNPNLYAPPEDTFWFESWTFVGRGADDFKPLQAGNTLKDSYGSLAENFIERVPGTDNTFEASWSKGTWKIGFDYLLRDDLFLYGYIATGFKAGGFGDKVNICDCDDEGALTAFPYDPEENTTLELGFKTTIMDDSLNLLGNVFYSDYTDMQRTVWAIVGRGKETDREIGTLITSNLDGATIIGAELEFDWYNPWPEGRIYGWISYLDAEIGSQPGGEDGFFCFERALLELTPCPPEDPTQVTDGVARRPADLSGNRLPWSPEWSLAVTASHNWYFRDLRLNGSLTYNWTDEMFFDDTNFDEGPFHSGQKAVSTVASSLSLISEQQQWALELFGHNLTDELIRSWSDQGPGYQRANFFPPRTFGLRLRKDF